jgi:hypothetical protein
MADAGVPVDTFRQIAGHGTLTTTQRYLNPTGSPSQTPARSLRSTSGPKEPNLRVA